GHGIALAAPVRGRKRSGNPQESVSYRVHRDRRARVEVATTMTDDEIRERARVIVQQRWGLFQGGKPTGADWLQLQAFIEAELQAIRAPLEAEIARLAREWDATKDELARANRLRDFDTGTTP